MNSNEINTQYIKMTTTPVGRLIGTLSVPTIISMLVTNVYNMADTAFVGRLGNSASGAVGVVFGFMAILQAIGFMFGQGSGSMASRYLGEKRVKDASVTASTGFFLALVTGAVIGVAGFLCINSLVHFLGSTDTIAPYAKMYIYFILAAAPFLTASLVLNNLLRYEGKAFLGMIGLMTGGFLNMAGDPFFMFVVLKNRDSIGQIAGAGISTALSQVISFCILLSMFLMGKTQCRISVKNISFKIEKIFNIMATGFPSLLRNGLTSISTVVLNNYSAFFGGDAAVAAMSIVSRICMFVFSFAVGIGQGFQPVCAFNYGAKKYDRVRKGYRFTLILAELLLAIMVCAVFVLSDGIVGIFRNDPVVIATAARPLKLQCAAILFLPISMITEMLMQSTGKKLAASILSSLRSGLFFIPALMILSKFRGFNGVAEAQPIAYVLSVIPSLFILIWFLKKLPRES